MSIPSLLADESRRLREFPVARHAVYLAHAGVCPLPNRVTQAVADFANACSHADQEDAVPAGFLAETRSLAARLLKARPTEIALVGPTSLALSLVANGLPLRPGDNILVYPDDYPTNVYPWMAQTARGIEIRRLRTPALGHIEVPHVLDQIDSRTRLVALASAHYLSGGRLDYDTLGRALRERDIWFCLDAIQTLGAFPMNVEWIDCLAADAHKWLLGPCAAGILYVRQSLQPTLAPTLFGWHNLDCPHYLAQPTLAFKPDARRYEPGSANLLGLVGLRAALELILEFDPHRIAAELLRKRAWFVLALQERGFRILGADASPGSSSAIVSADRPDTNLANLHHRLASAGVVTSLRTAPDGTKLLRFSPHFYNTDAELERALDQIDRGE
jgi:selenocysteine lyase/cysteine desulfurase